MTTRTSDELERRKGGPVRSNRISEYIGDQLIARALELAPKAGANRNTIVWPSPKYQNDPNRFANEIAGVELAPHQIEIVESVRDERRVAVASGNKIGKSLLMALLAAWFYCSFPDARAIMTSTTDRQVNKILWRELKKLLAFCGWCLACKKSDPKNYRNTIPRPCPHSAVIDYVGNVPELARTGLHASDQREIVGFTAREAEAVAGISGANLLYLVDEASGVPEQIFTAIRGNLMGGGRILMCSNPTQTEGRFFEAFDKTRVHPDTKKPFWRTFQISSETVAHLGIPGLASADEIDEARREYGEDSAFFKVRIKGEFVIGEVGKIISLKLITDAQERWLDTPATGRLFVGIDPAGSSGLGDESVFAPRRGQKIMYLHARRGLTPEGHLVELLGILTQEKGERGEVPVVVIDRDGEVGARAYAHFAGYLETHENAFELHGVRGSLRRVADKYRLFDTVRDELWGNLRDWLKADGAIPDDAKLAKELHAPDGSADAENKTKVTPKPKLREKLGRSPDRADAACLAVWEKGLSISGPAEIAQVEPMPEPDEARTIGLDPYAGVDGWRRSS
jgi:phage terminase large subunit